MAGLLVHDQVHDVLLGILSSGNSIDFLEVSVAGSRDGSLDSGLHLLGVLVASGLDVADANSQQIQISLGSLGGDGSLQSFAQLVLGDLGLVSQTSQTGDGNSGAVDGDGAVLFAGSDQDVDHLVSDGQCLAVDLNTFQDVGFAASSDQTFDVLDNRINAVGQGQILLVDVGFGLLQTSFQVGQGSELSFRHSVFLQK